VSELFTQGSVGGAAGNCCLYPATRIAKRRLIETGWACGDTLTLRVVSLARNRVISIVGRLNDKPRRKKISEGVGMREIAIVSKLEIFNV